MQSNSNDIAMLDLVCAVQDADSKWLVSDGAQLVSAAQIHSVRGARARVQRCRRRAFVPARRRHHLGRR